MDEEIETENNVRYNSVQIKVEPNVYDVSTNDTCPGTELSEQYPDIRTSDILPKRCFKSDIKFIETAKNIYHVEVQMNRERNIDDVRCPYSRDVMEYGDQSSDQQNSNKGNLHVHERPSHLLSNGTTYAVNIKYEPSSWDGDGISQKNSSISSSIPYTKMNDNHSHIYKNYIEASDETFNQDVQLSRGPIKYESNESNNYTHEKCTKHSVPYHDHDHTYSTCYKELYSSDKRMRIYEHTFKTQKQYRCDICSFCTTYACTLATHKRQHTEKESFKCDSFCYSTANSTKHAGKKRYKCDVCSYSTAYAGNFSRHYRKHTGVKPYKCNVCSFSTYLRSSLVKHKRRHTGEKQYKCDVCSYSTAHSSHFSRHKRRHTGEKPYKYCVCSYITASSTNLSRHIKRKHT